MDDDDIEVITYMRYCSIIQGCSWKEFRQLDSDVVFTILKLSELEQKKQQSNLKKSRRK